MADPAASRAGLEARCRALYADLGLGPVEAVTSVEPLTGGVASDIARIVAGGRSFCAKFALSRLRVEQDWRAPVHRSRAEYAWLERAGGLVPGAVPKVVGYSERLQGFLMEDVAGDGVYLWKTAMLSGRSQGEEAPQVAERLVLIHAAGARSDFDRAPFENAGDFRALRTDPYLRTAALGHPDLAPRLAALAEAIDTARTTLVHGDVSPKNILIRSGSPVLLDAECATMGDPAFDVAFCLNHLALKSVHIPGNRARLLLAMKAFWATYDRGVTWEQPEDLEARVAALLPALMLARVDGKSPVEYLDGAGRARVRTVSRALIADPAKTVAQLADRLEEKISE
jgi:aminoglycoside phosphotransferase (APT) family kinase protein